jgi:flagellin
MTIQNIAQNQMSPAMMRVASGQRINSAADDAAGLAISESMTAQIRGLDQGIRNTRDMQAMVQTAEGGLDTISDSLNRIRELSVQASNGTLNASQRDMIQAEISQLAQGIQSTVNGGVQFNSMNLLDGSVQNANTASSPDGTGAVVNINDMRDLAQAITEFNVTGDFNINDIDAAISEVAAERANLGAVMNRFDYTANANSVSSLNLSDARSRIADADMAREMMAVNQERVINELQVLLQRESQDQVQRQGQAVVAGAAV